MSAISVVMGSKSDWPTVKEGCKILDQFGVDYEKNVISAHRMPNEMFAFAQNAVEKGTKVIIACAGGAARNDCSKYSVTGNRDSRSNKSAWRNGFTFIHRSNASGNSSCYSSNWGSRSEECGLISTPNPWN